MTAPHSYHTFMFPFIWNGDKRLNKMSQFTSLLDKSGYTHWDSTHIESNDIITDAEYYGIVQYFKKDALAVLSDAYDKAFVERYIFSVDGKTKFARTPSADGGYTPPFGKYQIYKEQKQETENGFETLTKLRYDLDINQIRLAVFETGVALLCLETEYWGDKTVISTDCSETLLCSRTVSDTEYINEFGRRVALPDASRYQELTADKITLQIGDFSVENDFKRTVDLYHAEENPVKELCGHYIMNPIKRLLSSRWLFTSYSELTETADKYLIMPVCDDRMYVGCCLFSADISRRMHEKDQNGEYKVYSDRELYSLGFIEKDGCQNETMLRDILKCSIYGRWLEGYRTSSGNKEKPASGTLDIITAYSFLRVTENDSAADSFLRENLRLMELAVIQRATLIALENECCVSSAKDITRLQEKYVRAQKNILIDEVTLIGSGIEEFDMLRREMRIRERSDSLDRRLNDLNELQNQRHDHRIARIGTAVAFIALVPGILDILGFNIFELIEFIKNLFV